MPENGYVQCFLFENAPVRGCVARMDAVWQAISKKRNDPPVIESLLGELLAACALLSAHLKFRGSLSLQLMGEGPVSLLMAEYHGDGLLRATARYREALPEQADWPQLVGEQARFAVHIEQEQGGHWQGVVPVSNQGIAASLQDYFQQSEQLDTRLVLVADPQHCAGFLLQRMPMEQDESQDYNWRELFLLADTLQGEELLRWNDVELLQKLFAENDIRLFDAQPRRHGCRCERDGVARMIRGLGRAEANRVLEEQGEIRVCCEFCGASHHFDAVDVEALFQDDAQPLMPSRH